VIRFESPANRICDASGKPAGSKKLNVERINPNVPHQTKLVHLGNNHVRKKRLMPIPAV
jgi:hypothetical protein